MSNEGISKESYRRTSNEIQNYPFDLTNKNNNKIDLIKGLKIASLIILSTSQTVTPNSDFFIEKKGIGKYTTVQTSNSIHAPLSYRNNSILTSNFSNESDGELLMSDDIRQKDLDGLEKSTKSDIVALEKLMIEKLNHVDTKIVSEIRSLENKILENQSENRKFMITISISVIAIFITVIASIVLPFFF